MAQYKKTCNKLWMPFRAYMGPTFVLKKSFKAFRASWLVLSPLLLFTQLNLKLLRLKCTLLMWGSGTGMLVAGSNVFNVEPLVDLKVV